MTDTDLQHLLSERGKRLRAEQVRQRHYLNTRPQPDSAAARVRARLQAEAEHTLSQQETIH
jgi:hypothetical protein